MSCYVSGGRRRFCVAVTRVAVYNGCIRIGQCGQDSRSVKSTEKKIFGLCSFFRTPQRFAAMQERHLTSEIKLSGSAQESTWIAEIDEQPQHCLEIETRAMHCAQSRACSSSMLTRVDHRSLTRAHDSAHCKKILAPVTRYERETRY